jgi:hypothetical protein
LKDILRTKFEEKFRVTVENHLEKHFFEQHVRETFSATILRNMFEGNFRKLLRDISEEHAQSSIVSSFLETVENNKNRKIPGR